MVKSEDASDIDDISKMDDSFPSSSSSSSSSTSTSSPEIDVGDDQNGRKGSVSPPKLPFRPVVTCPTVPAPVEAATMPNGGFFNPFLDPKSLVEAYAARLHSEADYAR